MTQLRTMPQGWKQRGQTIMQIHVPTHMLMAIFCQATHELQKRPRPNISLDMNARQRTDRAANESEAFTHTEHEAE